MSSSSFAVFDLKGKQSGTVPAPAVFQTSLQAELIKRAVLSVQSASKQPQGLKPKSGRDNTAQARSLRSLPTVQRTINTDHARLPRMKNRRGLLAGRVAAVPQAVGGPKAHPPKVETVKHERINKKEKRTALNSAIAATGHEELVRSRHVFGKAPMPLVVEDAFEKLSTTKDVVKTLSALKVYNDVEQAKRKKRIRAGKGKARGRKYKQKKSLLIVTGKNAPVYKAARNLSGVDVSPISELDISKLAPGAVGGRLTLWTAPAVKALGGKK